jgi:hypothetical protein
MILGRLIQLRNLSTSASSLRATFVLAALFLSGSNPHIATRYMPKADAARIMVVCAGVPALGRNA